MKHQKITLSLLFCILCMCFTMSVSAATKYTVKFVDTFDGKENVLSSQSVEKNKAATAPTNLPAHKGFKFLKWSTKYNKITKNLTVKAIYKQTHTLVYFVDSTEKDKNVFYLNGKKQTITGKLVSQTPKYFDTQTAVKASDLPKLESKPGYEPTKWIGIKEGQVFKSPKILAVKTKYVPISYTIQFVGGPGVTGKMANKKVTYGKTITLPANTFKKANCKFYDWVGSDGRIYNDKAKVKNLSSEKNGVFTLTAEWLDIPAYSIQYDSDETLPARYTYLRALTHKSDSPSNIYIIMDLYPRKYTYHDEYRNGSYVTETGERTSYTYVERVQDRDAPDIIYKDNIHDENHRYGVCYTHCDANKFAKLHKITYPSLIESYTENTAVTIKNPTRMFYMFDKWRDASDNKLYSTYKIKKGTTGDKHLYATWKLKTYTITFKNGSSKKTIKTNVSEGQRNLFDTIFTTWQKPQEYFYTKNNEYYTAESKIIDVLLWNAIKNNDKNNFTVILDAIK